VKLGVFIDLDPGMHRTGIAPGEPALKLLETISKLSSLRFGGLQFYDGRLMHRKGFADREKAYRENFTKALETRSLMEKSGFAIPALSSGGTGTYNIDCEIPGVTDAQVGSYIFMDVNYRAAGGVNGPVFDDFKPSLFVLTTAISQPANGMITFDCGFKGMATDSDLPQFRDLSGVQFLWGGDEHGIVLLAAPSRPVKLGDKLLLIVSHCDPTVNLYDNYFAYRGEQVEALWPIAARGKSQ
jgi:3-hydroxy-D-aspartate aldolase